MTALPVSVVIVSHERPNELCLALTAVMQLDFANFETVSYTHLTLPTILLV